ncbi:bifunctional lycopene cyclase/phytoene synthase-like [Contarinia nasturtii]|uniref:bifunctional lycopene cyclase/phytoene synthase-like n=1 Tax=Contarinia nasturtii TaxID=265458 RepID=UPI0012D477A0|nr:bifunctional lycopene cyclase/phytoene synthase-like [Contarinia nasturtii]
MLIYMQLMCYYTVLPTIILYLVLKPLMSSFDNIKIILSCALTLSYTVPWINYVAFQQMVWYRNDISVGFIGYAPIEKYSFIIFQAVLITLWTTLCTRWALNSLHLKSYSRFKFNLVRYSVILLLVILTIIGLIKSIPDTKTFYIGSIAAWFLPTVIILWYICGPYTCQRYKETLISIIVPSIYLCYVNLIAMRAHIWYISENTSLSILPWNKLPIEEIILIILSNVIIVMTSHAFDKIKAINDTYYRQPFPVYSKISETTRFFGYIRMLFDGIFLDETTFDQSVITDLGKCNNIFKNSSKSFYFVSKFFPNDVRQDLVILNSFCRVTDDMVDNNESVEFKNEQVQIMTKFLNQLFSNRKIISKYCWTTISSSPIIDWKYFETQLTDEQLSSFRAFARIAYYLPQELLEELIDGYKWDAIGKAVLHEGDLFEYSKYVSSSTASLCTFVLFHKTCKWADNMGPKCRYMLENNRKIGLVIQIIHMSRDIIVDSEELGRCYIPKIYLKADEWNLLVNERKPHKIPNAKLKQFAEKMLDVADNLCENDNTGIKLLPTECQRTVLAVLEIYKAIGKRIRTNPHFEIKTFLSKFEPIYIILKCLYFTKME